MNRMPWIKRYWGHLSTITQHKFRVMFLCFKMGLIKQGLLHDLSKYSPVEFCAGVKYYQGYRSPIEAEKEDIGYSNGWLHHKGHNRHHWEYWIDRSRDGKELICYPIPKNYIAEMVCDRIAACQTYQKDKYTDHSALDYLMKGSDLKFMEPSSGQQLKTYLEWVSEDGIDKAFERIRKDVKEYRKSRK